MSVRATERLLGDIVIVTGLKNSPQMVVKSINEETKLITTSWFSNSNEYQEASFHSNALDRVEEKKTVQKAKQANNPKPKLKR
jgi:hypothetical protein